MGEKEGGRKGSYLCLKLNKGKEDRMRDRDIGREGGREGGELSLFKVK